MLPQGVRHGLGGFGWWAGGLVEPPEGASSPGRPLGPGTVLVLPQRCDPAPIMPQHLAGLLAPSGFLGIGFWDRGLPAPRPPQRGRFPPQCPCTWRPRVSPGSFQRAPCRRRLSQSEKRPGWGSTGGAPGFPHCSPGGAGGNQPHTPGWTLPRSAGGSQKHRGWGAAVWVWWLGSSLSPALPLCSSSQQD